MGDLEVTDIHGVKKTYKNLTDAEEAKIVVLDKVALQLRRLAESGR